MKTGTCERCGRQVYFAACGLHFKWLADPTNPKDSASWHCGTDPHFPTMVHNPGAVSEVTA
jgi:hypothetical protein